MCIDNKPEGCLHYDVVVVGGGIAGVMAAAAAAKSDARTLLVEASTFLGGVVTMGPLEALMTPEDTSGTVIAGMAEKFLCFLQTLDPGAAVVEDTIGYCKSIVPYDPEIMKYALWEFLYQHNVDVVTEAMVSSLTEENGTVSHLQVHTKQGPIQVWCKAVVDATGSGSAARMAGNEIMVGNGQGVSQPVTTLCRISGVDISLLKAYVADHPEDFRSFRGDLKFDAPRLHLWGFAGALKEGYEKGELELLRQEIHVMQSSREDEVILNYSRMNADVSDPMALSACQRYGMRQVLQLHRWFARSIPAFRNSRIVQTGYVGIRESGRGKGKYVLTREDILGGGSKETSIAMGAFPIDIHQNTEGMHFERVVAGYHIPMECLMAERTENLFLAGRCISATFEANASCRISMTCMSTGHAAGVMAAVRALDAERFSYQRIRELLLAQGAVL